VLEVLIDAGRLDLGELGEKVTREGVMGTQPLNRTHGSIEVDGVGTAKSSTEPSSMSGLVARHE
jgi:hypothetical protein